MRRTVLVVLVLVGLVSGCGDDGGSEATACSDVFAEGQPVEEDFSDRPCRDDDGETTFVAGLEYECDDGRTLVFHDYAWGYVGETWNEGELPPEELHETCNG